MLPPPQICRDKIRGVFKPSTRPSHACVCVHPGFFKSGLRGVLAGPPRENGVRLIERCDTCERFQSDEHACLVYARVHGGWCGYNSDLKVIWIPA